MTATVMMTAKIPLDIHLLGDPLPDCTTLRGIDQYLSMVASVTQSGRPCVIRLPKVESQPA